MNLQSSTASPASELSEFRYRLKAILVVHTSFHNQCSPALVMSLKDLLLSPAHISRKWLRRLWQVSVIYSAGFCDGIGATPRSFNMDAIEGGSSNRVSSGEILSEIFSRDGSASFCRISSGSSTRAVIP